MHVPSSGYRLLQKVGRSRITSLHYHRQVQQFIWRNLITRFEIPQALISGNGRQFNNGQTREYFSRFGIYTRFSTISQPQTNRQVETANKVVLKRLKTMLEEAKVHGTMTCLVSYALQGQQLNNY